MAVTFNSRGTSFGSFQIGKGGPTLTNSSGALTVDGQLIVPASTTSAASMRVPHGTAPTTPVDGDLWTTTASVFARVNGATLDLAASAGSTITVADESADTTSFPVFVTDSTGSLAPKTNTGLTFNAATGDLSSTLIGGIAVGNLLDKSATETVAGAWTFTSPLLITDAAQPRFRLNEEDAAVDNRLWQVDAAGEAFRLLVVNDAISSSAVAMAVERTGTNVDEIAFTADLVSTSSVFSVGPDNTFNTNNSIMTRSAATGNVTMDINAEPLDGTSIASVRIGRSTNTTGVNRFLVMNGNNSTGAFLIADHDNTTRNVDFTLQGLGDVVLTLDADTDNSGEEDNPAIVFSQDGQLVQYNIGLSGNSNIDALGNAMTNALNNGLTFHQHSDNAIGFAFGIDGTGVMTLEPATITMYTEAVNIPGDSPIMTLGIGENGTSGDATSLIIAHSAQTTGNTSQASTLANQSIGMYWGEGVQNLGAGEGCAIDFGHKLAGDGSPSYNVRIVSRKISAGDVNREHDLLFYTSNGDSTSPALCATMSGADQSLTVVGDVTANSDIVLKDNIEVIPNALTKVKQVSGVTFNRRDKGNKRHAGFIAQDVEKILPEVVSADKETGIKSLAYGNLMSVLWNAVIELSAEVDTLKKELRK